MMAGHFDRRVNLVLVAVALVVSALFVMAVKYGPELLSGADASHAVAQNSLVTSCRSQANAKVTDAATALDDARSRLEENTAKFTEAIISYDRANPHPEVFQALAQNSEMLRAQIDERRASLQAANDAYQAKVQLAATDPDLFIAQCKGD